jgi:peptidoglycan hydrolase-like protein with peptidoglycan-binding domain
MALAELIRDLVFPVPIEPQDLTDEVYTDFDSMPLDEPEEHTGDDSVLAETGGKALAVDHPALAGPHTVSRPAARKRRVVPFVRPLKFGMRGNDVVALKRALVHAKVRKPQRATRLFGATLRRDVRKFQQRSGLHVDGVYGRSTHAKLAPHYDNYGVWLLLHTTKPPDPRTAARQNVLVAAYLAYNNRYAIHYTQGPLRMMGVTQHLKLPKFPTWADCSAFATWCYYAAGLPDPNHLGYNGQGFTGTLAPHGRSVAVPSPADLEFYGHGDYDHVIVCVSASRGISHGSEDGPRLVLLNYRQDRTTRSFI